MKSFGLVFQASVALGATLLPRQSSSNTAAVNLAVKNGDPKHLASGFIYGIPDTPNQIPDHFYTGMGFNYGRFGGAQLSAGGWIDGIQAYYARFNSTKSNYFTARKYGAKVIILPHDVWGTDHANSSTVWPGDNGNWTNYDQFLNQLLGDLKANNMLEGLVWDTWNEPDGGVFWQRSQEQYLELFVRTNNRIRSDPSLKGVQITGPSSAGQPGSSWWATWLQTVVQKKAVPDFYSWHDEPADPAVDIPNLNAQLQQYKAPKRPININEYATFSQQNSAGAAWWISRLERYNLFGLRGNWLSTCQLHDFMASLLGKTNENSCTAKGYFPNGEWQVYHYYSHNMTGYRAGTSGTGDGIMDVYTTVSNTTVRTLTGVLNDTGTWYITINNLTAVGLPASGTLTIQTYGFEDSGHMGQEGYPSNRGTYGHPYTGGSVTFPVFQTSQDEYTAWAFEFQRG